LVCQEEVPERGAGGFQQKYVSKSQQLKRTKITCDESSGEESSVGSDFGQQPLSNGISIR